MPYSASASVSYYIERNVDRFSITVPPVLDVTNGSKKLSGLLKSLEILSACLLAYKFV